MNRQEKLTTLRIAIVAHLPALEQRVRKQELDAVIGEALRLGDVSPAAFLWHAAQYAAKASARGAQFQALRAAHEQAETPLARTTVLMDALREDKAPRRAFAALRRGWLDLEAMAERAELLQHDFAVRQSLALRAAAALCSDQTAPQVIDYLLDFLLLPAAPLCTIAAAEALTELLSRVTRQGPGDVRWERLCKNLLQPAPRRVLAALATLVMQAVPGLAMQYLDRHLLRAEPGDDFLLRQYFVGLLGKREQDATAFTVLQAQVRRGDPSEHVRIAWPAALRTTGGAAAVPLLEELAGVGMLGRADESPRVRAAAAIALAELVRRHPFGTTGALARLLEDPSPLVYQIVAEEIEDLARQRNLGAASAEALTAALTRRAAQISGELTEPTVRALEALATLMDPALAAARTELGPRLAALPHGAVLKLATQVEPLTFGRLLAQLAHDGAGFYAQVIAGGYRVERGARFVRRAWRLLHELRMHSPYKRQDALHTIGRQFHGLLRAPSGLLAEATTTAVRVSRWLRRTMGPGGRSCRRWMTCCPCRSAAPSRCRSSAHAGSLR